MLPRGGAGLAVARRPRGFQPVIRLDQQRMGAHQPQRWRLTGEPFGGDLLNDAVTPLIHLFPQPLLGELVVMGPALECEIPDEEVVLDVVYDPFILALGLARAGRHARGTNPCGPPDRRNADGTVRGRPRDVPGPPPSDCPPGPHPAPRRTT